MQAENKDFRQQASQLGDNLSKTTAALKAKTSEAEAVTTRMNNLNDQAISLGKNKVMLERQLKASAQQGEQLSKVDTIRMAQAQQLLELTEGNKEMRRQLKEAQAQADKAQQDYNKLQSWTDSKDQAFNELKEANTKLEQQLKKTGSSNRLLMMSLMRVHY